MNHLRHRRGASRPDQSSTASDSQSESHGGQDLPIEDSIDLHTFEPRDIKSIVADYIQAAWDAGFREVRLVHGRGRGVQRGIVQQSLDRHPLVVEFWDAPESHLGATVARLAHLP